MSDSLQPHGLYSPWNSPGQNTGVGSLSLLQGIFPTQGLNAGLPHCKWILYQVSYQAFHSYFEMVESLLRLLFTVVIIIIIILYPLLCESHKWNKKMGRAIKRKSPGGS